MTFSALGGASNTVGQMKHSFQAGDHDGWLLLNGRAVATLSATQQANAVLVGIGATLPNGQGRIFKQKGALWSVGGTVNPSVNLVQNHMPAGQNISATSSTSPNTHTHGISNGNNIRRRNSAPKKANNQNVANFGPATPNINPGGAHVHAYSLPLNPNAAQTALDLTDAYISANHFIYLGG